MTTLIDIQATSRVLRAEQGMASGLVNASFQIGAAVGLAAVTAVVLSHTGSGADAHGQLAGFHAGLQASPWAFPHELLVPRRRRRLFGEVDIALPATLRR